MANLKLKRESSVPASLEDRAVILVGDDDNDTLYHGDGDNNPDIVKARPVNTGLSAKSTPVAADSVFLIDSEASDAVTDTPLSNIFTGLKPANILFVSSNFAQNTGGYFTAPELAVSAASSGDLILVFAGSYTITSTLSKNGVDWYIYPDVTFDIGSTQLFITSADDDSYSVYGNLNITSDTLGRIVYASHSCTLYFEFNNTTNCNFFITHANATITIKANNLSITGTGTNNLFDINNGEVNITAKKIESYWRTFDVGGSSKTKVYADIVNSNTGGVGASTVYSVLFGGTATVYWYVKNAYCKNSAVIITSGTKFYQFGGAIKVTDTGQSTPSVITVYDDDAYYTYGDVILENSAVSGEIIRGGTYTVNALGTIYSNISKDTDITIAVGSLVVNSSVTIPSI